METITTTTLTLTTWQEAFEGWLRQDGRKGSMKPLRELTVKATLQDVRHFSRFLEQCGQDAFAPSPQAVKDYFSSQGEAAPASVNRRLASLRTLMRWAMGAGLIDQDTTARIPRIEMQRLPPRAKDELECKGMARVVKAGKHLKRQTKMHKSLGMRDQVIWSLMYDAGLRRAEVAGLRVQDVYLGERPYLQVTGKGGKVGQVAIGRKQAQLISNWLKIRPGSADGALVTDWNGQGISPLQVWRRFELICRAAGVRATPHDMRHTFVYRTVEEAMSRGATRAAAVGIACSQARHGDTRVTEMYLRPSSDFIYQVVEGMR